MVYQPDFKLRKFLEKCNDQPIICNNGFSNRTFIEFLTKIKLSSMKCIMDFVEVWNSACTWKICYKTFNISYCKLHHLCNHSCMSISSRWDMLSNLFEYTSLYRHERTIGCFYFYLQYLKTYSVFTLLFICFRFF